MKHIMVCGAVVAGLLAATAPAAVINISGTANGEQQGNGQCSEPCNNGALIDPVQVTFAAGSYTLTDAYRPTTGLAPGALYDAWNFEAGNPTGWVWGWTALYDDGAQGTTIDPANYAAHLLFAVNYAVSGRRQTEAEAAAFGAATAPLSFTVSLPTTIDFVVNDYYLADNAGGISLVVNDVAAVPEPATWTLLIAGIALVGTRMRRTARRLPGEASLPSA